MTFSDPIQKLALAAQEIKSKDIPIETLKFQQLRLLDNLACTAAGYSSDGVEQALAHAKRYSGCAEATVIGSDLKLAAGQAAFVNAVRARALDYCDVISPGWHPSSSDIPVALAMGEMTQASGADILTALAVGQDIGQRINLASQANGFFYRGFDSNVLGLFSGAVIAAKLLKLSGESFCNAIGLAFDSGIGTFQHYQDKSMAVRFGQAMVARNVIEAAMLAEDGVSGPKRILKGENGFFNLYAPGASDESILYHELGARFYGQEATCFKPYPHCSILLALTEKLLSSRNDVLDLDIGNAHFQLDVSPTMRMVCGAPYIPSATASIDAQFSACYIIANALLRGSATPADFNHDAAHNNKIVKLAQRIKINEKKEYERFDQCRLIIKESAGKTINLEASYGRGWPENPLHYEELLEKFKVCCQQSDSYSFRHNGEIIANLIDNLSQSESIKPLIHAMA